MKAGRDLDAFIAEEVMKWKPIYHDDEDVVVAWDNGNGRELFFTDPSQSDNEWSPSTNISDAWKVVEKYSYAFQLTQSMGNWECTLVYKINERGIGQYIFAEADTAPLAICLTAMKAYEKVNCHS